MVGLLLGGGARLILSAPSYIHSVGASSLTDQALAMQAWLMTQRTGAAELITGGEGGTITVIDSLTDGTAGNGYTDGSFHQALTDSTARIIVLNPNTIAPNAVYQKPQGDHVYGPNKTVIDNIGIRWQYAVENSVTQQSDVNYAVNGARYLANQGNLILAGITAKGNMAPGATMTPGANGDTEFIEIHNGALYWIHQCDLSWFTDEAFSTYHNPESAHPTKVTYTHNKVHNNRNGGIMGSQWATGNICEISQYYNWYKDTTDGRTPGLFYFAHAEVGGNVADGFTTDALTGRQGTEIQAWGNVIKVYMSNIGMIDKTARAPDNSTGGTAGPPGKMNSYDNYLDYDGSHSSFYDTGWDSVDATVFTPSYTHVPKVDTSTQAAIEAYVYAEAGVLPLQAAWANL